MHFYPLDDHYFDSSSKNFKNNLVQLPEKSLFLAFVVLLGSQKRLFDRLLDYSTDFLTLISNLIKNFKNSLSLLYFLLTLYSTFAQLSSIVEQMCLLKILLYSTLRFSVFTHTLGKIHFLLCFACLRFLWWGQFENED